MREPTNWDKFDIYSNSFFSKHCFENAVINSYKKLVKNINFDHPIKILEFGCGTGRTNLFLSKRFNVEKIVAIDFNKKMSDIAKQALSDISCEKEFINEDFLKIERAEQYDIVHSQGVIEHFEPAKRIELLKKHFDVTKKGGFCIVYSPIPTGSYFFFRKILEILRAWIFTDEVPIPKEVIIKEMQSFGFTTQNIDYFWKYFLTEVGILFKK